MRSIDSFHRYLQRFYYIAGTTRSQKRRETAKIYTLGQQDSTFILGKRVSLSIEFQDLSTLKPSQGPSDPGWRTKLQSPHHLTPNVAVVFLLGALGRGGQAMAGAACDGRSRGGSLRTLGFRKKKLPVAIKHLPSPVFSPSPFVFDPCWPFSSLTNVG